MAYFFAIIKALSFKTFPETTKILDFIGIVTVLFRIFRNLFRITIKNINLKIFYLLKYRLTTTKVDQPIWVD